MMIFTLLELFDAVLMSVVIGFIFKDIFQAKKISPEGIPIEERFSLKPMLMAMAVTVPAIALHELAHKLTAVGYGLQATFSASYLGLGIGLALKLIGSPFIFFIPAYVSIVGDVSPLANAMISLAGPITNLLLWLISKIILAKAKKLSKEMKIILLVTRKINGFLFILNMLPIPGFDGFSAYASIIQLIFT